MIGAFVKIEDVEQTRDAYIKEHQALVMMKGPFLIGPPYRAEIVYVNDRPTSAVDVRQYIGWKPTDGEEPNFFDPETDIIGLHPIDIPPVSHQRERTEATLTDSFVDGTGNSDATLYLRGGARYKTEYGDSGYLTYCYRFNRGAKNDDERWDACRTAGSNKAWVEPKGWFATLLSAF